MEGTSNWLLRRISSFEHRRISKISLKISSWCFERSSRYRSFTSILAKPDPKELKKDWSVWKVNQAWRIPTISLQGPKIAEILDNSKVNCFQCPRASKCKRNVPSHGYKIGKLIDRCMVGQDSKNVQHTTFSKVSGNPESEHQHFTSIHVESFSASM